MTQSGFKVKQSVTDVLPEMYLCPGTKLHVTELSSSKLIQLIMSSNEKGLPRPVINDSWNLNRNLFALGRGMFM